MSARSVACHQPFIVASKLYANSTLSYVFSCEIRYTISVWNLKRRCIFPSPAAVPAPSTMDHFCRCRCRCSLTYRSHERGRNSSDTDSTWKRGNLNSNKTNIFLFLPSSIQWMGSSKFTSRLFTRWHKEAASAEFTFIRSHKGMNLHEGRVGNIV